MYTWHIQKSIWILDERSAIITQEDIHNLISKMNCVTPYPETAKLDELKLKNWSCVSR